MGNIKNIFKKEKSFDNVYFTLEDRVTGNFFPGGGGEPFAQKFSQVAQIFMKQ